MSATLREPAHGGGGGGGADVFTFSQPTPAPTWTIAHNLGHYPAGLTVRLLSGEIVEPERSDLDVNTLNLTFIIPAAGVAELV